MSRRPTALPLIVLLLCAAFSAPGHAQLFGPPTNYATGLSPASVATGDFNGDGRPDLAVANSDPTTGNVGILLNNYPTCSPACFLPAVPYTAGIGPRSVAVGDFNGDGKLDLAVASSVSSNVNVLLGNGDGTFQTAVGYPTVNAPNQVVVADMNGDGKLDLVVGESAGVEVFLGNGDGTFQPALSNGSTLNASSVAVGDFNGDGHLDVAAADNGLSTVDLYLGNGDGTLQTPTQWGTGTGPLWVAAGDFNRDGHVDVVTADYFDGTGTTVSVLLNNGAGGFGPATPFTVARVPVMVTVGDLNGDGFLDLAVAISGTTGINVLLGNGDGTFQTALSFNADNSPSSVAIVDFNGDGKPDLAVTNISSGDVSILLNTCVAPTATVSGGSVICAGQQSTIQAALTGIPPWTVTWSDGVIDTVPVGVPAVDTRSVSPAATTTYTVTSVTDASRCFPGTSSGSATVTVNNPPSAAVSGTQTICAGGTGTLQAALTGTPPWNVVWSDGVTDTVSVSPDTRAVAPAATTTYTVTGLTDATGCSPPAISGSATVTVNPIPPAPTAANNGPVCAGQTLQLTASTVAGATYSWTGPNGFASSLQNPSIPSATTAASGTYSVTATVSGCTSSAGTTAATVNAVPSAPTAANNGPICTGQTLQLSASTVAGATYSWTGPNGFASSQQNPSIPNASTGESGTYTVVAIANGCASAPSSTNATINPSPSAVITAPASVPANSGGHSASVPNAGAGATYIWSINNGNITGGSGTVSVTFSVGTASPAVLQVTVRDASGCSASGMKAVTVGASSTCVLSCSATAPSTTAAGSEVTFQASASISGSCTGSPAYSWDFGDGSTASGQVATHSFGAAGTFTWTLTVTLPGAASCVQTGTITVAPGAPGCVLGCSVTVPSSAAAGEAIPFAASASPSAQCGDGSPAYSWSFGDGASSADQNPTHAYATPGSYTWTLTVSLPGATSCQRSGVINVEGGPPGCALDCTLVVPATAAAGEAVSFQATAVSSGTCSGSPEYSWNFGDGSTSNDQNPVHAYEGPGTFVWTETASLGGVVTCSQSGILIVTSPAPCVPPDAALSPGIDPIGNPGGVITITDYLVQSWQPPATGTPPSAYAYWINGDPPTLTDGTSAVASPRGDDRSPITLFVQTVACGPMQLGPSAMSPTYSLDPPTADFSVSPSPAAVGEPVTFTDTSNPQATGWLWLYDDGGEDFDVQSPTHTFTTPGIHTIALVATNGSGSDVKVVSLTVNTSSGAPPQADAVPVVRAFDATDPSRQRLAGVSLQGRGRVWLELETPDPAGAVVFLRIEDENGRLLRERRLAVRPGAASAHDLGAFGANGRRNLVLVSAQPFSAFVTTNPRPRPDRKGGLDE